MGQTQQEFVASQYRERAGDYVTSTVHATGADLDEVEAVARRAGMAARVLDLGCGGGHVSYRAAPYVGQVVACDVTRTMLDRVGATAREKGLANIETVEAKAEDLPFDDAAFDAVLCRFTTHHWQDMEGGLREARRVLKSEGAALFIDIVAAEDALFDTHLQAVEILRDASHVRDYRMSEWVPALGRSGFVVTGLTRRRLRMDFAEWTARTRTPKLNADAVRALQDVSPQAVRKHFRIEKDGSFEIESASFFLAAGSLGS